jgi:hypothetical protein
MKRKKQTTTFYGQLCQQNVFIENYLMGQIKTKVIWRFTITDVSVVEALNIENKQLATCLFYCSSPGVPELGVTCHRTWAELEGKVQQGTLIFPNRANPYPNS